MKANVKHLCQALILLVFFFNSCKNTPEVQTTGSLPRSTPETEGVSSGEIITFLDSAAANDRHQFHSIMIVRHGKVIAEGWWAPYAADLKHTMYSTSKSFTSTAVGFAVTENLITVNDKVVSFFPEYLPDTVSAFLSELTIKDLLTMSVGQDPDPTFRIRSADSNWVKTFLAVPIVNKPGSKFLYNSLATYMQSAIVQKVTGEKIIDYLTPRLFEPLGIRDMDWELDPMGFNVGGWGLRVKTEDMAKFGLLYLQEGKWYDKQVIPSAWVEEATTFKIDQAPDAPQSRKDSSDWMQGYCYQFWRSRNNAFRADGAFGQYIIVMPEKDAVVVITAESPDMQDEINLVWNYILPAMKDEALPEDKEMSDKLKQRLASLALPLAPRAADLPLAAGIDLKTIKFQPNDYQWQSLILDFTGETCDATLKTDVAEYKLNFGSGKWITGETGKIGPSLTGKLGGIDTYKIAGSYSWKDEKTLELVLRYIESPHYETITCTFEKVNVLVKVAPSIAFGTSVTEMKGTLD